MLYGRIRGAKPDAFKHSCWQPTDLLAQIAARTRRQFPSTAAPKLEAGVGIELDLIFLGKLPNIFGSPKTVTPTVTPFSHERR